MNYHGAVDICSRVRGSLFIGNSAAASNLALLKNNGISHVLICCSEVGPAFPEKLEYKKLNIQETFDFNIAAFFEEAFEFIDAAYSNGHGVLVHCMQGQSRSPTIMTAYLMKKFRMSASKAFQLVLQKHPSAQPNGGFMEQLNNYEKSLSDQTAASTCSVCSCLVV
jgi:hypothetical protein